VCEIRGYPLALTDLLTVRQAVPRLASTPDAEITRLIAEASDVILAYLNRAFDAATYTETYDSGDGRLFLRHRPVTGITSIATNPPAFDVVTDPAAYRFDPDTGEVRAAWSGGYFPGWADWPGFWAGFGWRSVKVVYTAGAAVPPAVSGACLRMLNRAAAALTMNHALRSKSMGNVAYTYADLSSQLMLDDDDLRTLSRFKNWAT
jgi:hypothetical protein